MLPEQVDEILKTYRAAKGRAAHMDVEIAQLSRELHRTLEADRDEAADISGQHYNSMPHGTDVGRPTEEKGMRLISLPVSEEVKAMQMKIRDLRAILERHSIVVLFVEAWMNGLTGKEQWIIQQHTIDGLSWKEVSSKYNAAYGQSTTVDTLKRIKRGALDKIYTMAQ